MQRVPRLGGLAILTELNLEQARRQGLEREHAWTDSIGMERPVELLKAVRTLVHREAPHLLPMYTTPARLCTAHHLDLLHGGGARCGRPGCPRVAWLRP